MVQRPRPTGAALLAVVLFCGGFASAPAAARQPGAGERATRVRDLPPRYRQWLEEVALLITAAERRAFLELEKDYQRDGFIAGFWESRGSAKGFSGATFEQMFRARLEEARSRFGGIEIDQARVFILQGEPHDRLQTDCGMLLWPLDFWGYAARGGNPEFLVLFYQPYATGPYRIWQMEQGFEVLLSAGPARGSPLFGSGASLGTLDRFCGLPDHLLRKLQGMLNWIQAFENIGARIATKSPRPDPEWLQTYEALSTDLPPDARTFAPQLTVGFTGRLQSRAVVRATLTVPAEEAAAPTEVTGRAFELFGEVLRQEELLETFRYRFELPPPTPGQPLPLVFERSLRPGEYTLVLRVVEGVGGRQARLEQAITVPALADLEEGAGPPPESAEGTAGTDATLRLVAPVGDLHSGGVRIEAQAGGTVRKVAFHLDGRPVLTRTRPPYTVELALGRLPRARTVRAVGYDAEGTEVATDELVLNPAPHAFGVRLVEPRRAPTAGAPLAFRVDAMVPEGRSVERVELFVDDRRVATLFQPPWFHETVLELGAPARFARAVAHLDDGVTAEAAVSLRGDGAMEEIEVDLVEVYVTVVDGAGQPVHDLGAANFTVLEDGVPQAVRRFERVAELPLHIGLLVDTSASMERSIGAVQVAAVGFFEQVLEEGDRGAVVTFSDRPRLVTPFTSDPAALMVGLVGLAIENSTALHDSVVFALNYFQGIRGQRALLVLSDGADRQSRHTAEDVLEYARHAGVTVYTIQPTSALTRQLATSGRHLARLAEETGGRSFALPSLDGLADIYATIERDLRSRYLLVYQSAGKDADRFRQVDVRLGRPELSARHMAGYYP